ncbi:MAG TPA: hypothetical protein DFH97_04345 [Clostridiales bacterium]|nr:hypothetical protein [Clostridiales bacterium]HBK03312.1 hypothetical protein [Clostridiales bacterium]HCI64252.1 hypothetical protein [Clostridiales bacterium]
MSELEEKLGAMLSNPQLMQQISSLVQAMGQPSQAAPPPPPAPSQPPEPDFSQLQGLMNLVQQNRMDANEQALLSALSPYLSPWRMGKLERAMRATKMAGMASVLLRSDGLNLLGGR